MHLSRLIVALLNWHWLGIRVESCLGVVTGRVHENGDFHLIRMSDQSTC